MNITKQSLHYLLPRLLNALAECHFVALDLELSGISLRQNPGRSSKSSAGKQTLQQRYEEVKEAAERYQVLQIGLTLATEDVEAG
jgi:poly(A)-specific ribonuclease